MSSFLRYTISIYSQPLFRAFLPFNEMIFGKDTCGEVGTDFSLRHKEALEFQQTPRMLSYTCTAGVTFPSWALSIITIKCMPSAYKIASLCDVSIKSGLKYVIRV